MIKFNKQKTLFIFVICLIFSILNILHVIIGYAKTSPGQVYMATGHYYLDYFEYVQAITQGMKGNWLWENYSAIDDPAKRFSGIGHYLLLGKVGAIFGFNPIAWYWIMVFIMTFGLAFLIYIFINKLLEEESFIKQVIAFLFALFSGPFFHIIKSTHGASIVNYSFWGDKNTLWRRFGSIPHQIETQIISLIILFWLADSSQKLASLKFTSVMIRALGISILILYLLTFSPSSSLLLAFAVALTALFILIQSRVKKDRNLFINIIIFSVVFFGIVIPLGLLLKYIIAKEYSIVSQFETLWQVRPGFSQIVLVHGPIAILSLFGIWAFLKKLNPIRIIFLLFISLSYVLFLSPLPQMIGTTNVRFLTPLSYILLAVLACLGFRKLKALIVVSLIFFVFALPANLTEFNGILSDRNIFSPITYLPSGIVEGFEFLDKRPEKGAVLTTPSQFLGSVLPIYTLRHTFVARHNSTPNYTDKNIKANTFYLGAMKETEASDFLTKNSIRFVVLTSIEGYPWTNLSKYTFLKEIYRNPNVIIFKVM